MWIGDKRLKHEGFLQIFSSVCALTSKSDLMGKSSPVVGRHVYSGGGVT